LGSDVLGPVAGVDTVVNYITNHLGANVIIDPHNNDQGLRYNGQDATRHDFVNLWKAITKVWGSNPKVILGLYNEPRYGYEDGRGGYFDPDTLDFDGQMIGYWTQWMQEAIDAIRQLGSTSLILVPGLHWTTSRDWDGAGWWGPSLDGVQRSGNTMLASLQDPAKNIAYDVHQYMDPGFTGTSVGCAGAKLNAYGGPGADWGLEQTVAWAQKYNKKMMMTEIGSWPADDGTNDKCKEQMQSFLRYMHDSGVFIGYQVWQFGCSGCQADQWTLRPYNLDWYDWAEYGRNSNSNQCSSIGEDCRQTKCCKGGLTCFEKNQHWASCRATCTPGIHEWDPVEYQTPWSCTIVSSTHWAAATV